MIGDYTPIGFVDKVVPINTETIGKMDEKIAELDQNAESVDSDLSAVQSAVDKAQDSADSAQSTADSAVSKNSSQDTDITALQTENAELKAQIAEMEEEISELNSDLTQVNAELTNLNKAIRYVLVTADSDLEGFVKETSNDNNCASVFRFRDSQTVFGSGGWKRGIVFYQNSYSSSSSCSGLVLFSTNNIDNGFYVAFIQGTASTGFTVSERQSLLD